VSTRQSSAAGLAVEAVEGAAARAGVKPDDCIVAIDGAAVQDVLDLELAAADGTFELTVLRDGRQLNLPVMPRRGEWHGLTLLHGLGVPPRRCVNHCRFCFVDQVPAGLRAGLSVKDDDYRLSFLNGNFITLSNLDQADLARIEALRLSPLFVSLHDWDDERRVRLMGKKARGSRATLLRLVAAGIEVHVQIVLCPGWNDGSALVETILALAELDGVADVGVVPVSLAEEGDLHRVRRPEAEAVLARVEELALRLTPQRGYSFVYAADEFYLLAGERPPLAAAELQYENGIGICAAFLGEAGEALPPVTAPLALLSGTLAEPIVSEACALLVANGTAPAARSFTVTNGLFGSHVTVTGLLGGGDVLKALVERPLAPGEWLLAPRSWLPEHLGRTLDDVTEAELIAAAAGRLIVAASLGEGFGMLRS
jgi:putative radical SAM enzyme (TIGR03279 family)